MTKSEIQRLIQRIKMRWRRNGEYTALFEDGAEVPVIDPQSIITDGMVGLYKDGVTTDQLEDDLGK